MRSLPKVLASRPKAHVHVLIVGGDQTSYGRSLRNGQTYKQQLLTELDSKLDTQRVHFLGKVPYSTFVKVLQVSRAHGMFT
jgi:hypothetical protein